MIGSINISIDGVRQGLRHLEHTRRQIVSITGIAHLVMDDGKFIPLGRKPEHCLFPETGPDIDFIILTIIGLVAVT